MRNTDVAPRQIGAVVLATLVLTCMTSSEGLAQTAERVANQPREAKSRDQGSSPAPAASSGQQTGAMRYYGGPKSPMWRGAN